MITIKSEREIDLMRRTCQLAANTLKYVTPFVKAGISTLELDEICHDYIVKNGAIPSPLNYNGYPKSICTSVNEVICHGIPDQKTILKEGDIVNVDITTYLDKFHGDNSKTFMIGEVRPETRKLVEVTYECLMAGIDEVKPGNFTGDIGAAITKIAHSHNYSVVEEYCGHGIGREFHEGPQIIHNAKARSGTQMRKGMTFTVEPMINLGTRHCQLLADGWTVITRDKKLSAQFEHTVLVTEDGVEILTLPTI